MTALQICNAALIKLGAKTISSLDDNRKEAELCTERYPRLRDAMLKGHVWAFAKQVQTLEYDEESEISAWSYTYSLPADTARILSITTADEIIIPFERVGDLFYCNETSVVIRYVASFADVDDGFEFPDDFGEALACLLAADLCISLTQTQALRDTYINEHAVALSQARFNGAVERYDMVLTASSWIAAHDGLYDIDPTMKGLEGY